MKNIIISILILCISNAIAFNITDFSAILSSISKSNSLCALYLVKYNDCINSLAKATNGVDVSEFKSNDICPIFEDNKCKTFVDDIYNKIECDTVMGEVLRYTLTLFRLYYLSFCTTDKNGNSCPITNLIQNKKLTADETLKILQDSCNDENCNKGYVAMANIIDKNINNKYLYEYLIGFTLNTSIKALAKGFKEGKCATIDVIVSNKDLFVDVEDLYNNIVSILYNISYGNVPNYASILSTISSVQYNVEKEISNSCLNQFKNYEQCFKQFSNYEKNDIKNSSDITDMCTKFESDDCKNLLSDLNSNKIQCDNSYLNDTIYRAIFIALRFSYISACTKTKDNSDYCPIAKFLHTSHKIGETSKDFLTAVTDNCEDTYCSNEFYKLLGLITDSNIYNSVISTDFDYTSFFNKFKNHVCSAFKIGLGIFGLIEDVLKLINEIIISVLHLGNEIVVGLIPDYYSVKEGIENLNKHASEFGINKECLSQVWRYSSCVKLFISDSSYNNIDNITTTDICNIFDDKNCEPFVNDLLNDDFKCIDVSNSNENIYKKIHETLKLTYLSTCSKTNNDEYCPVVEFMNTGTNITEVGTDEYKKALKSTCEDTSCNKSFSDVYKIIYENDNENKSDSRKRREIEISTEDNDYLPTAISLLENKKCAGFANVMALKDANAATDGSTLSVKINVFSILMLTAITMVILF
ncbi:hypothetical protein BCR32DRAFT_294257 [Anaeromyces robustus]|uniref:Extracellular membrane protein CFEM domain-containing protein n=1 Tax=Anaeromyces robustus TaxID=1754192 RepID=A0A1Y1X266_9FUNG|nr:hypothetical protein BCR32DRAFT_294257 [Anaeromyces robustus]|eukprot:ORX79755.1 hypothetical protein BCR32DRAFT_294257 [Anaeromyces robustus]